MDQEELNKQASPRKVEANRENAQRSTGPRTIRGKRNSSRNSLKHGLFAKDLVVSDSEDIKLFVRLLSELRQDLKPHGRVEDLLVESMATCVWRSKRVLREESRQIMDSIGRSLPPADEVTVLLRYQSMIHRQQMQLLRTLEDLQRRRQSGSPPGRRDVPET